MCVIAVVYEKRPDHGMVEDMVRVNPDGTGMAWRSGPDDARVVEWEKDISLADAQKMCDELPMPFVFHARIETVGGVCKELIHPFPVDLQTDLTLRGKTTGSVLFHNGSWSDWRQACDKAMHTIGLKVPPGRQWSDSRAMAWLSAYFGKYYLDWIQEKGVIFGPHNVDFFHGKLYKNETTGWKDVNGIWCSNDVFTWKGKSQGFTSTDSGRAITPVPNQICNYGNCTRADNLLGGRCPQHRPTLTGPHAQQQSPWSGSKAGSGGVPTHQAPFYSTDGRIAIWSLYQAETCFEAQNLSKNKLKKARKYFEKLPTIKSGQSRLALAVSSAGHVL